MEIKIWTKKKTEEQQWSHIASSLISEIPVFASAVTSPASSQTGMCWSLDTPVQGPHRRTCWIFGGLKSVMWSAVMKTEQGVGSSAYNLKCHLSVTESEGCVDVMQMLAVVKGRSQDEQTDSCRSIHWRSARENRLHPDDVVTETRDYREYYSQGKRHLSRRGALTVLCLTHIRCWYMTRNHEKHT